MSPTVRPAAADEAALVAELNGVVQQQHHRRHPDRFKPADATALRPLVDAWLSSPSTALFVAQESGGDLLGYAVGVRHERPDSVLLHGADLVELDQVVVVPDARRRGVGRALCSAVIDWAEHQGASHVELSTWDFNEVAQALFESLGFRTTVRRMSRPPTTTKDQPTSPRPPTA